MRFQMSMVGVPMYFWHDTWYSSDLDKNWYRVRYDTNKEHIKNLSNREAPFSRNSIFKNDNLCPDCPDSPDRVRTRPLKSLGSHPAPVHGGRASPVICSPTLDGVASRPGPDEADSAVWAPLPPDIPCISVATLSGLSGQSPDTRA